MKKILTILAVVAAAVAGLGFAIGPSVSVSPSSPVATNVVNTSCYGAWVVVQDDARTAQSAANLLNPAGVSASVCKWVRIDRPASKIACVRAKVPIATSAVGTSPVVRVFAGYGTLSSDGSAPTDGTFRVERLDNASWTAAGLTLTFPASPTTSNCANDAVWFYSASVLQTPTDLRGAQYILVEDDTAGACTASAAMPVEAVFLN